MSLLLVKEGEMRYDQVYHMVQVVAMYSLMIAAQLSIHFTEFSSSEQGFDYVNVDRH